MIDVVILTYHPGHPFMRTTMNTFSGFFKGSGNHFLGSIRFLVFSNKILIIVKKKEKTERKKKAIRFDHHQTIYLIWVKNLCFS